MKFTRNGSVQLIAGVIAGAGAIVVACGGDDSTSEEPAADAGASSTSSTSSTSSSSGTTSSSSTSSSGSSGDASTDASSGGEGGAKKANGEACTQPNECQSGVCFVGGKESYCTIKCTMTKQTDPVCQALGGDFSGECNNQGFCRKK